MERNRDGISQQLGDQYGAIFAAHLKMLHDAELISAERQGREVRYRLDCKALTTVLRGMADALEQCQASCCTTNDKEKCT